MVQAWLVNKAHLCDMHTLRTDICWKLWPRCTDFQDAGDGTGAVLATGTTAKACSWRELRVLQRPITTSGRLYGQQILQLAAYGQTTTAGAASQHAACRPGGTQRSGLTSNWVTPAARGSRARRPCTPKVLFTPAFRRKNYLLNLCW